MKRYPITSPLSCWTSSAAAFAEPPSEIRQPRFNTSSMRTDLLTSGNDIVHNEDLLALTNSVLLHLEKILAILLDVLGSNARSGKLALLANSSERNAEAKRKTRAEKETTGVEANDNVGLGRESLGNLELEGINKGGMGDWVGEERHNVDEVNSRDREVGEAAQRLAQAYLCTGEFGGTGGGGGGLSSRGILSVVCR